ECKRAVSRGQRAGRGVLYSARERIRCIIRAASYSLTHAGRLRGRCRLTRLPGCVMSHARTSSSTSPIERVTTMRDTVAELRLAVIGAGHGGRAMAADLGMRGFHVNLWNRTAEHIEAIRVRGGIELQFDEDQIAFGPLEVVSSDIQRVLEGVHLIMVVLPASAHADVARLAAPYLEDGQIVVLNPGRTGGALEFRQVLKQAGCTADVTISEAETLLFASRAMGPAEARIFRRKNTVPLAALPATRTGEVLDVMAEVYPQFVAAPNVLYTSLNNMGAVFHPALTLLNSGWIERTQGDFQFYVDGVTRSTAHMLEVIDRGRVTVAAALGIRAQTALEWL